MRLPSIALSLVALLLVAIVSGAAGAQVPTEPVDTVVAADTVAEEVSAVDFDGAMAFDDATPAVSLDSLRSLYPGLPAAVAFAALPDSVMPLLPQSVRLDMLDYAKEGQHKVLANALRGNSWLDSLGTNLVQVRLTGVSNVQVGVYHGGKGIVAMNYSITPQDAAADSQLLFYTDAMQPVPVGKVFRVPGSEDLLNVPKGAKVKAKEIAAAIPFPTVRYILDPAADTITAIPTVQAAMTLEDFDTIKPYLRPAITYRWNGKRFEKEKDS